VPSVTAECRYPVFRYADCRYPKQARFIIVVLSVVMLIFVILSRAFFIVALSGIMLSVVVLPLSSVQVCLII
jgi:hypothetical protein